MIVILKRMKKTNNLDQIPILKKGGIHIKKKNIGSFTRYCGGNVTQECIERGKNSPSAAIRKKSVFADNARRWKHENGGILKALYYANYITKKPAY